MQRRERRELQSQPPILVSHNHLPATYTHVRPQISLYLFISPHALLLCICSDYIHNSHEAANFSGVWCERGDLIDFRGNEVWEEGELGGQRKER